METLRESAERMRTKLTTEILKEAGKKGGATCAEKKIGVCGRSKEQMSLDGKKAGNASSAATTLEWKQERGRNAAAKQSIEDKRRGGVEAAKVKFKCLVTGHISTAPGLSSYQRKRGIDTSLRERV
jgi:hypothetical protein